MLNIERVLQSLATTCLVVCVIGIWLTQSHAAGALRILGTALTVIGGLGELAASIPLIVIYCRRRAKK